MARSLCQTVIKLRPFTKPCTSSSRLVSLRTQSSQPNHFDQSDASSESSSDPLLRKLEDAIHRIIVRRSAPDWLPFLPGSSYWVPPPTSQSYGLAQIVEKLANPLTPEESLSTTTIRGWPSSEYFIKDMGAKIRPETRDQRKDPPNTLKNLGKSGSPHPVEVEMKLNASSKSEEEG